MFINKELVRSELLTSSGRAIYVNLPINHHPDPFPTRLRNTSPFPPPLPQPQNGSHQAASGQDPGRRGPAGGDPAALARDPLGGAVLQGAGGRAGGGGGGAGGGGGGG